MKRKPIALASWKMEMTIMVSVYESVSPAYAQGQQALPCLDGLGAARKGHDPNTFASTVRQLAEAGMTVG